MKRLTLALAAIGLTASCGALAAFPAATNPSEVSVPQLPGGFFIGGLVSYSEPTVTNGDLVYASTNSVTSSTFALAPVPPFTTTTFSSAANINPGYDWGWGVYGGYVFPNTGNDVTLSYYHIDTTDSSSIATPGAVLVDGNVFNFISPTNIGEFDVDGFADGGFDSFANSKASFHINQVDLTAGQLINVGCRLRLHPNAGLRWASVDQTTQANFGTPSFTDAEVDFETLDFFQRATATNANSNFNGIGPVVGVDATYYVAYGFGAVGHFDTAVLVGNISSNLSTTSFAQVPNGVGVTQSTVTQNFSNGNTRRIVPVVDAKLGADYTWLFNNSANSDLTLEAGWQFSNYFNAVDYISGLAFGQVTSVSTSDVGLQGPYVSLTFHA